MESPKVTNNEIGTPAALHGRWYGDACGTAFALELVGERWSLLIVRELMLGGLRFSDLRASLPGISAKVLTERLTSLEAAGLLAKRKLPPPGAVQVYELTEWGYLAEPAIRELGRWAARSPDHNAQLNMSPVSFMLSLRTLIDAKRAREFDCTIGFTVAGQSFLARPSDGTLPVHRAKAGEGEIGFTADAALPLLRVFYGKQDPQEAAREGSIALHGDPALIRRFIDLFSLPEKIGIPPVTA